MLPELLLSRFSLSGEHREVAPLCVGDPCMGPGKLTGGFAIVDGDSLSGNALAAPHHLIILYLTNGQEL
jgi:hypothetical protein